MLRLSSKRRNTGPDLHSEPPGKPDLAGSPVLRLLPGPIWGTFDGMRASILICTHCRFELRLDATTTEADGAGCGHVLHNNLADAPEGWTRLVSTVSRQVPLEDAGVQPWHLGPRRGVPGLRTAEIPQTIAMTHRAAALLCPPCTASLRVLIGTDALVWEGQTSGPGVMLGDAMIAG